ncbi:MAG: hypothetical protein V1901_02875 [Patescibacteria group bacterium]
MPIIGYYYDKILMEKNKPVEQDLQVKNKVHIIDIEETDKPFKEKGKGILKFKFEFELLYEPKIGKIIFEGHILYMDDEKITKDMLKTYKKDKKLPQAITLQILNTILYKAHLKALDLGNDLNLPAHLPIPKISSKANMKDYIG